MSTARFARASDARQGRSRSTLRGVKMSDTWAPTSTPTPSGASRRVASPRGASPRARRGCRHLRPRATARPRRARRRRTTPCRRCGNTRCGTTVVTKATRGRRCSARAVSRTRSRWCCRNRRRRRATMGRARRRATTRARGDDDRDGGRARRATLKVSLGDELKNETIAIVYKNTRRRDIIYRVSIDAEARPPSATRNWSCRSPSACRAN